MAILMLNSRTSPARVGSGDGRPFIQLFRLWWPFIVSRVPLFIALLVGCLLTNRAASAPAPPAAEEYEVKAAFLYNFAKFVEWPAETFADAHAPLVLGIVGEDPFGSHLDSIVKGKTVDGRALKVKRLKRDQDLKGCHILFVSSSEKKYLPDILEPLKRSSVLTVSEIEHFARHGGIINFVMEDSKVRFEINVDTAEQARLKISSKLLMLAKVVRDKTCVKKHE